MKIQVNKEALELVETLTVEQLLVYLDKPLMGSAVAVNQEIIRRSNWTSTILNEGDDISLFQAIAGG